MVTAKYRVGDLLKTSDIVPGDRLLTIVEGLRGERILTSFAWGFKPQEGKLFNARIESAAWKNTWSEAFKNARAIVPVTSFELGQDIFGPDEHFTLGLAAVYDKAKGAVAILTQPAMGLCRDLGHNRMPVVIPLSLQQAWLSRQNTKPLELKGELSMFVPELRLLGRVPNPATALGRQMLAQEAASA